MKESRDNGASWRVHTTIYPGKAAYSDLVQIDAGTVGVLFECGKKSCYEKIAFCRIALRK